MNHVSLFSGIGGIDRAAEWAGFTTVAFCENDPYCIKVLNLRWPGVPICEDIHEMGRAWLDERGVGAVDLLTGGPPCQSASVAGKRRGTKDDRWLWGEAIRIMREIKPRYILWENPLGILSTQGGIPFEQTLLEMEREGYAVQPYIIPACGVDAPHLRERVFIVDHHISERLEVGVVQRGVRGKAVESPEGQAINGSGQDVAHAPCTAGARQREHGGEILREPEPWVLGAGDQRAWWPVEPDVGRVAHGIPHRVDRLKCLGNAVVPAQVYPILAAIAEIEEAG